LNQLIEIADRAVIEEMAAFFFSNRVNWCIMGNINANGRECFTNNLQIKHIRIY